MPCSRSLRPCAYLFPARAHPYLARNASSRKQEREFAGPMDFILLRSQVMKMRVPLLLTALLLLAADAPKDDAKKEQDKFQGTWKPVSAERNGEKAAPEAVEKLRVLFAGDKLSMKDSDQAAREVATFKLDPAAKVKTIDLMLTSGPEKGKTSLGIYAWDGDNMKLCIAKPGSDRPTEFGTKAGSDQLLLVLKKEK